MLNEQDRQKLDGIVQQMTDNGESDADIQFVVDDFKSKYGNADNSIDSVMKPAEPEKKTLGGFLSNTVKSGGNFLGGLATAVTHPVQTLKTVGSLALGAGDNLLEMAGLSSGDNRFNKMADMVGHEYKDRYGGWSNIKNTAYNDPVGVLADLATVLSGGAGVATKVGKVAQIGGTAGKVAELGKVAEAGKIAEAGNMARFGSKASELGSFLNKTSSFVDPLQLALKGASKVAPVAKIPAKFAVNTIGVTTGKGAETFNQIWEAAKSGRNTAVKTMRGGANEESLIKSLDDANEALRGIANEEWTKLGLDDMKHSLDISPIDRKVTSELASRNVKIERNGMLNFEDSTISDIADQRKIQEIYNDVKGWGTRAGNRTPRGVDTLKQRIANKYNPKVDSGSVKSFVAGIKKETRKVLGQVDGYDEYSKNYGEVMDLIDDLKTEMKQGAQNPQTTWNKITNTFKQRNTEARQAIVRKLQDRGISNLADEIAGYSVQKLTPDDIIRVGAGGFTVGANPLMLPLLSPRAMGEVVNFLGKKAGQIERVGSKVKNSAKTNPATRSIQYLGGQVYNKNKATRSSTLQQRLEENQED